MHLLSLNDTLLEVLTYCNYKEATTLKFVNKELSDIVTNATGVFGFTINTWYRDPLHHRKSGLRFDWLIAAPLPSVEWLTTRVAGNWWLQPLRRHRLQAIVDTEDDDEEKAPSCHFVHCLTHQIATRGLVGVLAFVTRNQVTIEMVDRSTMAAFLEEVVETALEHHSNDVVLYIYDQLGFEVNRDQVWSPHRRCCLLIKSFVGSCCSASWKSVWHAIHRVFRWHS